MIDALCGFAALLRSHGGDVGTAELIDAARALTLVDLADRAAVCRALTLTIAWSAEHPDLFDRLVAAWFDGGDVELPAELAGDGSALATVTLDADAVDATRIHTEDALAVDTLDADADTDPARTGEHPEAGDGPTPPSPGTAVPDGTEHAAGTGELVPRPPRDDAGDVTARGDVIVELPAEPPSADLELARSALAAAAERRRAIIPRFGPARSVMTLAPPLSAAERARLDRAVRLLDRRLDGAASWRRARAERGAIDLRRTMRRAVTTGGLPSDLRHIGRRADGARLVVLVDLSVSVRGTARLVLHLVHRMRTMRGSVRSFGFVDSCVSIDRALRVADPHAAIGNVLALVDVDAASNPGAAVRQWWTRSHHLVTPTTHVVILGDGRCNGHDPAVEVIERITRRSASSTWITPEPRGAWALGRGEMVQYATHVDRAVTVRSLDDLERLVEIPRRAGGIRRADRA
jgi:uncharacterized protein with von Willebrand factor type A (vWA) domain